VGASRQLGREGGDLAEQEHSVEHGVAQHLVGIPALAAHAVQVLPDRLGVVNEIGYVQFLTPLISR
jgi:hypothetical protein